MKNPTVKSRYQATAGEDTEGWKMLSVYAGDF
jgi:hypothetical protein